MRRVYLSTPKLSSRLELNRRQKAVGSVPEARSSWNSYRQSVRSQDVISALKDAAGVRMRCFYCSDSLAADVDHFVPISVNFNSTFQWKNFIWVCPVCNRHKSNRFPVDSMTGIQLLINPTNEDPWIHLILDTDTGVLAPRYWLGNFDMKGTVTLEILEPINYEAAIEGRMRTVTRLREVVSQVPGNGSSPRAVSDGLRRLFAEVRYDDYGVSAWFGLWDGKDEREFRELSTRNPDAWRHFVRYSAKARYGRA
jgi:5-methylcytosine-specific restriction endonuclease McrA